MTYLQRRKSEVKVDEELKKIKNWKELHEEILKLQLEPKDELFFELLLSISSSLGSINKNLYEIKEMVRS